MESVIAAAVTGALTLIGVLISNSRSQAVIEVKLDELSSRVDKHNNMIERTYRLEQDVAVIRNDIEQMRKAVLQWATFLTPTNGNGAWRAQSCRALSAWWWRTST